MNAYPMLVPGKSYKVKVELEPGKIGYGHAQVLEKAGTKTFIRLHTGKDDNCVLPIGSRIWFVCDSSSSSTNNLCSAAVVGTKIFNRKTAIACGPLKLVPIVQRRRAQRVPCVCPVYLPDKSLAYSVSSYNISRSGIGLEAYSQYVDEFPIGQNIKIILSTPAADLTIECKVVRTEYNWLSNRTMIGLQFITIIPETMEILEQLLKAVKEESDQTAYALSTSLSNPLRTTKESHKLINPHFVSQKNKKSESEDIGADDT